MSNLPIKVAFWDYDRTMPIADGRVAIGGCAPEILVLPPQEIFVRALRDAEFDVCELSLSRYAQGAARGDSQYIAVPVYPSRAFRHASVYIRSDRDIERPADLRGRRIGLHNFDDTAAVVVRGLLRDEYGLKVGDVRWVSGKLTGNGTSPIRPQGLSSDVHLEYASNTVTLDQMLLGGEIDGLMSLLPPASFNSGNAVVRRLFRDHREAEESYFARTGMFPIMHVLGLRRTLASEHPWLARNLYDAFLRAKSIATDNLDVLQASKVTLPWVVPEYRRTQSLMGEDYWPYGVSQNRKVLAASLRHLAEEGLLGRPVSVEDLFEESVLDT